MCSAVQALMSRNIIFNQDFDSLPESIKQELHIMCVLYTEDIGGILTLEFDDNGSLQFKTEALDSDAMYDDIGSVLKIKQLQTEKENFCSLWKCIIRYFSLVRPSKMMAK